MDTNPSTMRAAIRERYGSPDAVELREVARPTPIGDQVLVRVAAASVNRADLDLIKPEPGFTRLFLGIRAPRDHGIGCDVAGTVEAVGPKVTAFKVGDRVFGDMYPFGLGSLAEYKVAPERAFLRVPDAMSFDDAATLPHAAILAVQGLRLRNGRRPGTGARILVDGACGNVGPFAIQIAKSFGAEVTAVDRADKLDVATALGADHVIDYTTTDYTRTGERYDWILDVHSHHPILDCRRALRPSGVYVTLGGPTAKLVAAMVAGPVIGLATRKRMGLMLWWKPFAAADVETLAKLHATGALRPAVDRRYALEEVVEALHYVDDGHARGKVLVTP